jgi:hypothetical protein
MSPDLQRRFQQHITVLMLFSLRPSRSSVCNNIEDTRDISSSDGTLEPIAALKYVGIAVELETCAGFVRKGSRDAFR